MELGPIIECTTVKWTRPPDTWFKIKTDGNKNMEGISGAGGYVGTRIHEHGILLCFGKRQ